MSGKDDLAARERYPDFLLETKSKEELLDMVRENWILARNFWKENKANRTIDKIEINFAEDVSPEKRDAFMESLDSALAQLGEETRALDAFMEGANPADSKEAEAEDASG